MEGTWWFSLGCGSFFFVVVFFFGWCELWCIGIRVCEVLRVGFGGIQGSVRNTWRSRVLITHFYMY